MTKRHVPLNVNTLGVAEIHAAQRVLKSGYVTQGHVVEDFEEAVLAYVGADARQAAVMVNSGSSANLLQATLLRHALQDLAQEGRDLVIMPALTWATTVAPFIQAGFKPLFVDVGWDYTIDPAQVEKAVETYGDRVAAIVAVHLLGTPADMTRLKASAEKAKCALLEDACEALGAQHHGKSVGAIGDAGSYSFYFSHHCSTIEGGLLVYPKKFHEVLAWREHGWIRKYPKGIREKKAKMNPGLDPRWLFDELGYNVRSTDVNAAIGLVQLKRLPAWQKRRQVIANEFRERLHHQGIAFGVEQPKDATTNPFSFPILLHHSIDKKSVTTALERHGIETRPMLTGDITQHPWYQRHPEAYVKMGKLDVTMQVHRDGFLIPCHPFMTQDDVDHIVHVMDSTLRSTLGERR